MNETNPQKIEAELLPTFKEAEFVLLKDIDWFGRLISAGTIYRQISGDYYHPIIKGARCPSLQLDFYTVKNNGQYFLQLQK